jgi:hypothetical protein
MVAEGTLPTRQHHRQIQIRVEKLGGRAASPAAETKRSVVGVFAALLVEWKLAEHDRADSCSVSRGA